MNNSLKEKDYTIVLREVQRFGLQFTAFFFLIFTRKGALLLHC